MNTSTCCIYQQLVTRSSPNSRFVLGSFLITVPGEKQGLDQKVRTVNYIIGKRYGHSLNYLLEVTYRRICMANLPIFAIWETFNRGIFGDSFLQSQRVNTVLKRTFIGLRSIT